MKKSTRHTIRAGQYFACKYEGDNGDLILGKVKSVRATGEVILENLLTGSRSTKSIAVLKKRNVRISKKECDMILGVWLMTSNDRPSTRRKAVEVTRSYEEKEKEISQNQARKDKQKRLIAKARSLIKQLEEVLADLSGSE